MNFQITLKSANVKTGAMPVTTSSAKTCPDSCPLKAGGCYAKTSFLGMHWHKVTAGTRGESFSSLLAQIRELAPGALWRHNQAGDLPGTGDRINKRDLVRLARSNKGKRGFTYTHKPPTARNLDAIRKATREGFTINLSANSLTHADKLAKHRLPVVAVLPSQDIEKRNLVTPRGTPVVVCPATRSEYITCKTCGLCQKGDRAFIIGFPAHGTMAEKADAIARN
jgi:hypothetical protein